MQGAVFDFGVEDSTDCAHAVCGLRSLIGEQSPREKFLWKRVEILVADGHSTTNSSTASFAASLNSLAAFVRSIKS